MKKIVTVIAAAFFCCFASPRLSAQKIGHLNVDSLMTIWPAYQAVIDSLAEIHIQVQQQAEAMYLEVSKQQHLIDSTTGKVTETISHLRQAQLQQMQNNYVQFTNLAQQELQQLQARLSDTLYKQLNAAIDKVARSNGYSYIMDSSPGGQVLFATSANDVFELVRAELKIPLPAKKATSPPQPR